MIARDAAASIPAVGSSRIKRSGFAASARAMGHTPMEDGKYVMIEVEDTGGGIKPEHAAKIVRPYHSTKEAGKGTGLGLATSYGII